MSSKVTVPLLVYGKVLVIPNLSQSVVLSQVLNLVEVLSVQRFSWGSDFHLPNF